MKDGELSFAPPGRIAAIVNRNRNETGERTFPIQGKVWRYPGPAGWFFVNTGLKVAEEIRFFEDIRKVGLGYIKVTAQVGGTRWDTTLFPTKEKDFLLAIKAKVRKSEGIEEGQVLKASITLHSPEDVPENQRKKPRNKIVRSRPGRLS
jgi:hypothetical protein